jgi:hypothetical protein
VGWYLYGATALNVIDQEHLMKKRFVILLLFPLLWIWGEDNITVTSREDWFNGDIIFDISTKLPSGEMKPTNRFEAEQAIESEAPDLISKALKDLKIDSWKTIGSLYFEDPLFYSALEELIGSNNKTFSKTSQDMKEFIIRYTIDFYPQLISLFISHDRPVDPDFLSTLNHRKEDFTGLVIYAGDSVPYHGNDEKIFLEPALFPSVYDEKMNLVFDKTYVEPDYLKQWGMVMYSDEIPDSFLETRERIGMKPIKISLREVFGRNKCDLIISEEDRSLILSSALSSNWLKEGRILIIINR